MSQYNRGEDLEKVLANLQERQHMIRQFVQSSGWKALNELCEGAITTRRQAIFNGVASIQGLEDCFNMARLGSEVAGIQYVLALPGILLRDIEADIRITIAARKDTENE